MYVKSTLKKAAALLLCQMLLLQVGLAIPTEVQETPEDGDAFSVAKPETVEKFGGPVFPITKDWDIINNLLSRSKKFPLGRAPAEVQPCNISMTLLKTWQEGNTGSDRRRRIEFNVPRPDIDQLKIPEAATIAWYYNWAREWAIEDRCGCKSYNFQIWKQPRNQWWIDFSESRNAVGDARAMCQIKHFYRTWGQWTGCDYDDVPE